ncbi:MAG: ABC transporter ATP-binding protein [Chthonomonas sp.]|nr:ABC transporter ATP-binding protein [Chthonomonas sp.]
MSPVLEAKNVSVDYHQGKRSFRALNGVSLAIEKGETVALVGESGCGKTTLARAILGLQSFEGEIMLDGFRVDGPRPGQAKSVGVVWQDPFASLDPRWRIGDLIQEPATVTREQIDLADLMKKCGLSEQFAGRYPHQMSGGQRQRVAIARALSLEPPLVICDEPTSALDLSVQAQILNLLKDMQGDVGCSYLYISHDLGTVRYISDRIAVMYLGRIVEEGPTEDVFSRPMHPYTELLIKSALTAENIGSLPESEESESRIPPMEGCAFRPRCPYAQTDCGQSFPTLFGDAQRAACFHPLVH